MKEIKKKYSLSLLFQVYFLIPDSTLGIIQSALRSFGVKFSALWITPLVSSHLHSFSCI